MFQYDYGRVRFDHSVRSMWRYRDLLPIGSPEHEVSLGEGLTPLLQSRLKTGLDLWLKDEGRNPTGSMKDRALSVAVSAAKKAGRERVIIASTGSAGMAAAAYSARAGLRCLVIVPSPTARERLVVMAALGAEVLEVQGSFEAITEVIAEARRNGWEELTTYRKANPYQAEGPKTIAYELADELSGAPDAVIVPIGGGGTLGAIWRGFKDLAELIPGRPLPRLFGVQNVFFNALQLAMERNLHTEEEIKALNLDPSVQVIVRNLKHSFPHDSLEALQAVRESGGTVVSVTDEQAVAAQVQVARADGIFTEPSSATTVAALTQLRAKGLVAPGARVVAILSGSGLREIQTAVETIRPEIRTVSLTEAFARVQSD
jgi:threonine synthase